MVSLHLFFVSLYKPLINTPESGRCYVLHLNSPYQWQWNEIHKYLILLV